MIRRNLYLLLFALLVQACTREATTRSETLLRVSDTESELIRRLGFSAVGATRTDSGFLVERDIFIPSSQLIDTPRQVNLRIATAEQYRTYNTVKVPRTITVSCDKMPVAFIAAVDTMINRYNRLNLNLKFRRVASLGSIYLKPNYSVAGNTIAFAGFPTATGDPYQVINVNMNMYKAFTMKQWGIVLQHEVGHCIGLRHTDYMDRSFSCFGNAVNEGSAGVGAVLIPGTPATADQLSFMLACFDGNTNLSFNANDIIALTYLYKR